jgi:hypothetical protein
MLKLYGWPVTAKKKTRKAGFRSEIKFGGKKEGFDAEINYIPCSK